MAIGAPPQEAAKQLGLQRCPPHNFDATSGKRSLRRRREDEPFKRPHKLAQLKRRQVLDKKMDVVLLSINLDQRHSKYMTNTFEVVSKYPKRSFQNSSPILGHERDVHAGTSPRYGRLGTPQFRSLPSLLHTETSNMVDGCWCARPTSSGSTPTGRRKSSSGGRLAAAVSSTICASIR